MQNYSIRWLILLLLSFISKSIFSQNLVPNGNFEEHVSFDNCTRVPNPDIQFLKSWKPSGAVGDFVAYCHRDLVKRFGVQRMKEQGYIYFDTLSIFEGNAMVKLHYGENCPVADTGCASYLKTKLTSPLELGEVYEASMWVYTKINPAADTVLYSHIGMYLSRHELNWKSEIRIPEDYFFYSKIIPGQWTEIKWYIRALCSLEYLTIGVFRDDAFPSLFRGDPANDVFYFVDHVAIKKVNEDSLSADIHPTPYCEYYEKEDKQRILESITSLDVHYESNASTLDEKDKMKLDSFYQANLLRKNKIFIITGYTDNEKAENISLSKARSESVKFYLQHKYNLPEMSLLTFGFGSSHPVADNSSSSGRLQNRRTTIRTSDLTISQLFYRKGLEYVKRGSYELAYAHFERSLRMIPLAQRIEIVVDPRLEKMKHSRYWNSLLTSIRKGYSLYNEPEHAYYLDSLYFEDQLNRSFMHNLGGWIDEIDTTEAPEHRIIEEQGQQKDDSNFTAVQKYLERTVYPEISKVGRRPARGLGYVILHQGDSMTYVKTLVILKDLCMKGEAEWDIFAKMSDKLSVIRNVPQEYGTQFSLGPYGEITLYKIDDIEQVNKRRVRIGMPPTAIPDY